MWDIFSWPSFADYLRQRRAASTTTTPALPTSVSPSVLATLNRQAQLLGRQKGRKSTLLTGGLLGTPSLAKQGLFSL